MLPRESFNFGSAAPNLYFLAKEAERQLESISAVIFSRQSDRPIVTIVGVTDCGSRPMIELDFLRNEITVSNPLGAGRMAIDTVYKPNSFEEWYELTRGAINANFGYFKV